MDLNLKQWLSRGVPKGSDMIFLSFGLVHQLGAKAVDSRVREKSCQARDDGGLDIGWRQDGEKGVCVGNTWEALTLRLGD